MIITVADVLQKLKEEEEKKILDFSSKFERTMHPTIIGDMYEGVATRILEKSVFRGLDLRVVSGQITNSRGDLSKEIDCMIVEGDGDRIPNTNKYIYSITNVIAVVEVKKNLNKADLFDSYFKMLKVSEMFDARDISENEFLLFRDAFRSIAGMEVPSHEDVRKLDVHLQMIYHTLLLETLMPLRIVFGFYGYRSMNSLRQGFNNLLQDNVSTIEEKKVGFSPGSFPNLIFTNNSSLVKTNGMPYIGSVDKDNFWEVFVSSSHNPLMHFLELLWTKLSYKHGISSNIFGEDLDIEGFFRYLGARPVTIKETLGWEFRYVDLPKDLDTTPYFYKWEPFELTLQEFILITMLCEGHPQNSNSNFFNDLISEAGVKKEEFIKELNRKRLIYEEPNGDLKLLTDECLTVIKDEKFYAGENKDGKMANWISKKNKN